jgi:carbon-monoxide dehydrogenase medium subunit
MPNVMTCLDAQFELASSARGVRRVAARDFMQGPMTTCLADDEILTAIHVASPRAGEGSAYEKFSYRRGDFAVISVAVNLRLDARGRCEHCAIVIGSLGSGPFDACAAARIAVGEAGLTDKAPSLAAIAAQAARECEPVSDRVYGSADYKRHLVEHLTARAVARAFSRAHASQGANKP